MFYRGKKCHFYHFFMECHSIQFTTISINVERGIVKILFKYRYFQDLLIDIDIDIDISLILLIDIDIDIDIFQNHHIDIDIDIDIFWIALSISISISIFSNMTISISISISIFFKSVDISTIDMSYRYIEQGYSEARKFLLFHFIFCPGWLALQWRYYGITSEKRWTWVKR